MMMHLKEPSLNEGDAFEELIYLLSHDLRNSVRALIEIPSWIEEDLENSGLEINSTILDDINLMTVHARRLDYMLLDLLEYSRVGREPVIEYVDLGEAIEAACDGITLPEGCKLTTSLDCKEVKIGRNDIIVLFRNLINNAIKHNLCGPVAIDISSCRENEKCIIRVQDDGVGIEAKFRERVFEVMTTLRSRDDVEGSGVGLATVKKIAQFYGGTAVCTDTTTGRGVMIEVTLPA